MSLKRRHWSSEDDGSPKIHQIRNRRHIRGLPFRRPTVQHNEKFTKYRSISNTSSTDLDSSAPDSSDTELGTALSDVESEIRYSTRSFSPTLDEGDEVDQSLRAGSKEPLSPSSPQWGFDVKGKGVDPREYFGDCTLKRRRMEDAGSGSEGDDEAVSSMIVRTKKKSRPTPLSLKGSNFGPTRSILEITLGIDNLGEVNGDLEIIFSSDEDDEEAQISAELLTAPPSPSPTPSKRFLSAFQHHTNKRRTSFEHLACKRRCVAPGKIGRRSIALACHARREAMPRRPLRPYMGGSDSELEKMITSDVEREMVSVNNEVKRRKSSRASPTRLPGQHTTAKLRRVSPTSLLPLRERKRHLSIMRPRQKHGYVSHRPVVGQVMLAVLQEVRNDRIARRKAVLEHNKRLAASAALLPSIALVDKVVPKVESPVPVCRPGNIQLLHIWKKRQARDLRRVNADRMLARNDIVGPVRLPPPTLSPTFVPLPILSPEPPVLALPPSHSESVEEIVEDIIEDQTTSRSSSPTPSDPPEYEPPAIPVRMNLPAHLRPRPAPRCTPIEVPCYPWLSQFSGGEYHRLSPPPPPPFNALTDAQTVIAPNFIDDDDEEEVAERVGPTEQLENEETHMIGSFPEHARQSETMAVSSGDGAYIQPAIVAPIPVRSYDIQAGRSSWEAALDLEEADADSVLGDLEDMVDELEDEAVAETPQSNVVLGSLGRLLGRVWRW